MRILAHRTARANAPPNSLEGLQFCRSHGVTVAECDVSFTKDEWPIIWPDYDNCLLKRPRRSIGETPFEVMREMERIDCAEKLLTVDGIFSFLKASPGFRILFDVKYYIEDFWGINGKIPNRLVDLTLERVACPAILNGLARQIGFVTFGGGFELLGTVKKISGDIFTNPIIIWPLSRAFDDPDCVCNQADAITIGWGFRYWNHWRLFPQKNLKRLIRAADEHGCEVWGGLANKPSQVRWLEHRNFNGVWTDDIRMAEETLRMKR